MSKNFSYTVIVILSVLLLWLGFLYTNQKKELAVFQQEASKVEESSRVENFLKLFVMKVLSAEGEVNFDDRLKLENDVRALNNPKILSAWNIFVGSATPEEAQTNLRNLISVIVDNI